MMTPTQMQRKLRQLDNDVQSVYEMLASISATQGRQGNRLDELDVKLDTMDIKLDTILQLLNGRGPA